MLLPFQMATQKGVGAGFNFLVPHFFWIGLSIKHNIPSDVGNEWWISGDCYLRDDLYNEIQAFNRSPCPKIKKSGTIECGSK